MQPKKEELNSQKPKVVIVIINWNSLDNITECLNSLRRMDYPNYEIVVVDNFSSDGSPQAIERDFPEVALINSKQNLGFGGGNNLGIKYALSNGAKYVWLLNNDTIVKPDTLDQLVLGAETSPDAALFSPLIYYYNSPDKIEHCGSIFDHKQFAIRHFNDPQQIKSIKEKNYWLWATALLLRREVIEKIGYMSEKYFVYGDDMEYSLKALVAGYRHQVISGSELYHKSHAVDLGGEKKLPLHFFYYTTRNNYLFWMENTRGLRKITFLRRYLIGVLKKVAIYQSKRWDDVVDAALDGLYCGFSGRYGQWDKSVKIPRITKKIILSHPYLWIDILEGDVKKIIKGILKKIGRSFQRLFSKKNKLKHYIFLENIPPEFGWGGCEALLLDYLTKADYRLNKITLVTTKDIFSQRFKDKGIPAKILIFPFNFEGGFRKRFINMFNFLGALRPSHIIFVHNNFLQFKLSEFFAGFLITRGNIFSLEVLAAPLPPKKVSTRHFKIIPGIGLWWWKQTLPIILRGWLCKKICAVSEEVRMRMIKWYYYPTKRIFVTYHGVDIEKFSPDLYVRKMMRKNFNIPETHTIIISTARLCEQKCLHRLIDAFDVISKNFKDCWLFLLGDGPLRGQLQELTNQKQSKERIKFLGFQEEVSDYLKMSDIFVLPSDNEGLSGAMLEAMAVGLISVIANTPGAKEVIIDGYNGFLVESSKKGILEGLARVLLHPTEQRQTISNSAREFIKKKFDIEKRLEDALRVLGLDGNRKINA